MGSGDRLPDMKVRETFTISEQPNRYPRSNSDAHSIRIGGGPWH